MILFHAVLFAIALDFEAEHALRRNYSRLNSKYMIVVNICSIIKCIFNMFSCYFRFVPKKQSCVFMRHEIDTLAEIVELLIQVGHGCSVM